MSVYYLGAVNVIGFLLYGIHLKLFRQRVEGQVDIPLMCLSLAGGSGGIFLSMLFFDRKVQKENVLLKVWNLCLLVIQIMVLLLFKEYQNHVIITWGRLFKCLHNSFTIFTDDTLCALNL